MKAYTPDDSELKELATAEASLFAVSCTVEQARELMNDVALNDADDLLIALDEAQGAAGTSNPAGYVLIKIEGGGEVE